VHARACAGGLCTGCLDALILSPSPRLLSSLPAVSALSHTNSLTLQNSLSLLSVLSSLSQVGNDMGSQYRHGVYFHTPEQVYYIT
jgi:hypothetical protein